MTRIVLLGAIALVPGTTVCGQSPDDLAKLQKLIAPSANESKWMQVPWMPSSNIYAARKKAAEEGKPILLWYMAGEPLGTC
jgi:hypothetical protein